MSSPFNWFSIRHLMDTMRKGTTLEERSLLICMKSTTCLNSKYFCSFHSSTVKELSFFFILATAISHYFYLLSILLLNNGYSCHRWYCSNHDYSNKRKTIFGLTRKKIPKQTKVNNGKSNPDSPHKEIFICIA